MVFPGPRTHKPLLGTLSRDNCSFNTNEHNLTLTAPFWAFIDGINSIFQSASRGMSPKPYNLWKFTEKSPKGAPKEATWAPGVFQEARSVGRLLNDAFIFTLCFKTKNRDVKHSLHFQTKNIVHDSRSIFPICSFLYKIFLNTWSS